MMQRPIFSNTLQEMINFLESNTWKRRYSGEYHICHVQEVNEVQLQLRVKVDNLYLRFGEFQKGYLRILNDSVSEEIITSFKTFWHEHGHTLCFFDHELRLLAAPKEFKMMHLFTNIEDNDGLLNRAYLSASEQNRHFNEDEEDSEISFTLRGLHPFDTRFMYQLKQTTGGWELTKQNPFTQPGFLSTSKKKIDVDEMKTLLHKAMEMRAKDFECLGSIEKWLKQKNTPCHIVGTEELKIDSLNLSVSVSHCEMGGTTLCIVRKHEHLDKIGWYSGNAVEVISVQEKGKEEDVVQKTIKRKLQTLLQQNRFEKRLH